MASISDKKHIIYMVHLPTYTCSILLITEYKKEIDKQIDSELDRELERLQNHYPID